MGDVSIMGMLLCREPTVTDLALCRQAPSGPILLTTPSTTSARQTLGAVGPSIAYDPPFLTHPKRAN